jgi:hypothetical protein
MTPPIMTWLALLRMAAGLSDIEYLVGCCFAVEFFYALANKFCPKRVLLIWLRTLEVSPVPLN